MAKSIIQNEKECLVCKSRGALHEHHVLYGVANRKLSDKYGLTVWLCPAHHTGYKYGVHFDHELDLEIKKLAQHKFEEIYSHEEFMRVFGKNYL